MYIYDNVLKLFKRKYIFKNVYALRYYNIVFILLLQ